MKKYLQVSTKLMGLTARVRNFSHFILLFSGAGTSLAEAANSVFVNAKQSSSPANEARTGECNGAVKINCR